MQITVTSDSCFNFLDKLYHHCLFALVDEKRRYCVVNGDSGRHGQPLEASKRNANQRSKIEHIERMRRLYMQPQQSSK